VKESEPNESYGKNNKRIVFTESDHRHAKLILKLKGDGLTQAKFFRSVISGYLDGDDRIREFVFEHSEFSQNKKKKIEKLKFKGDKTINELGLNEDQVDDLFDVISMEFPDL
tara:strand:+ start:315 stop:650 length:336 start_codon:yes stop_codon:yes gene_type:complete